MRVIGQTGSPGIDRGGAVTSSLCSWVVYGSDDGNSPTYLSIQRPVAIFAGSLDLGM